MQAPDFSCGLSGVVGCHASLSLRVVTRMAADRQMSNGVADRKQDDT